MSLLHSNAEQLNSFMLVLQMPEISVHIVPAVKGLSAKHSEPHEHNAKNIIDHLRKTYGNGNLLDPMGMCVIPNPRRLLVAGEYKFLRSTGKPWRDQMLWLDMGGCLQSGCLLFVSCIAFCKRIHSDDGGLCRSSLQEL